MKMLKRLGAIAIAAVMLAAVGGIPAAAATDPPPTTPTAGSITINENNPTGHNDYSAYPIATFDVTKNAAGKTVFTNIKMDATNGDNYRSAIIDALSLDSKSKDSVIFDAMGKLQDEADQIKVAAIKLRDTVTSKNIQTIYKSVDGKIDKLPVGYYLVLENKTVDDGTTISSPMLISVPYKDDSYNVTISVKNSKAGITKKIIEHDTTGQILVDSNTAAIGDTVHYQSIAEIPTYPQEDKKIIYYVTDTFCKALDFDSSSIDSKAVTIIDSTQNIKQTLVKDTDYKLETSGIDNATFRITLLNKDSIKQWGNAGYRLKITYSAKLNADANTGKAGNPNSTNLTYSIKPGEKEASYTTPNDLVITYAYRLVVTKKVGDQPLNGAVFELQDANGKKIGDDVVTVNDGKAVFTKLQQGTYQLVETAAPAGYNKCDPITFTVGATNDGNGSAIPNADFTFSAKDNGEAIEKILATWSSKLISGSGATLTDNKTELDADVQDTPGFVLPGTGGIGTTIFIVSGIAILLVGGLLAFLYYKKKKDSRQQ